MSTLNGKTIFGSLKPLNPTVRVYSNLRRNMGRKRGDETFKHSIFTHFTKDWNWKVCNRTKITRTPCRKRTGTAIPRAENFGDLMTAKNKVLSDGSESWNNRRYSVVVQDLSTQWIQSYPRKKNFTWNRKKLAKVRGVDAETQSHLREQFPRIWQSLRRPILESLSVNTSPSRDEQDCWKSGTSAALLQSGLDEKWWADSMECFCCLRYNSRSLVWWEDTLRKAILRSN